MRRTILAALITAALAACGGDIRATKLTPDLLENQAELQKIANRLTPDERPVFARYLLSRTAATIPFGEPIQILNAAGKDPGTVAEALELTRRIMALEVERDAKMAAASKRMDALSRDPDHDIAAYNAAVAEHNQAIADFEAKVAQRH